MSEPLWRCPSCGHAGGVDDFDVINCEGSLYAGDGYADEEPDEDLLWCQYCSGPVHYERCRVATRQGELFMESEDE